MNDDPHPSSPADLGGSSGPTEPGLSAPRAGASAGAGGSPEAGRLPHPSYVFLAVVSIVSLVADLATKEWATKALGAPFKRIPVIDGIFYFVLAQNKGGAWGLLQNESDHLRRPFFLLISVVAILFIVSLYRRLMPGQWALKWGLPLVLGGALGNLVDRIRYGHVVDFIQVFYLGPSRDPWPTFNVADVAICVGVGLMAIDMFTTRKPASGEGSAAGAQRSQVKPASAAPVPPADG